MPAQNPAARLVCLPHAGGSAPFFRPVAVALGEAADVVCVQYPGRQDRRAETPIAAAAHDASISASANTVRGAHPSALLPTIT